MLIIIIINIIAIIINTIIVIIVINAGIISYIFIIIKFTNEISLFLSAVSRRCCQ